MKTQESNLLDTGRPKENPETNIATSDKQSLYDIIAGQPFFAGMNPSHLQLLADSAMRTQFDAGKLIFQKGDPANRFYVILRGAVVLDSPDKYGIIHRVQNLGPHDVLGWSWLFPPFYWHFDAVANEPTDAVFFYGTRLREECSKDPEFGYELMKRMSQILIKRLQATRQKWIEVK